MRTGFHEHPGEENSHLGIVSRLTGNGIPYASIHHLTDTIRISLQDLIRGLKLNQTPQCITGHLAKQVSLGKSQFLRRKLLDFYRERLSQIPNSLFSGGGKHLNEIPVWIATPEI